MRDTSDNNTERNNTPEDDNHNSAPSNTEIEQPGPSTATPSIPQEIPIR